MKLEKLLAKNNQQIAIIGSRKQNNKLKTVARNIGKQIAISDNIMLVGCNIGMLANSIISNTQHNGKSILVSPESTGKSRYGEFVINTGFGYKGRNVILIRSADVVVALPGELGTLNEITIALDEGKMVYSINSKLELTKITKKMILSSVDNLTI